MRNRIALIPIAMVVTLTGCDPDREATRIEGRLASPGGQIEAVSAEDMGGDATVTGSTSVYLVEPGRFPRLRDRVFVKERACFVRMRWLDANTLAVSFAGREGSFQTGSSASAPAITVRVAWRGRDMNAGC